MTQKHTLKELLAAEEASKHNSDLANIATALTYIKRHRTALKKFVFLLQEELENTEGELHALAAIIEGGEEVSVNEIRKLYTLAQHPTTTFTNFEA